jgi:hypothetical protein
MDETLMIDPPPALRMAGLARPFGVDRQYLVPQLFGSFFDTPATGDAGVVNQDVQFPPTGLDQVDGLLPVVVPGYVQMGKHDVTA